MKRLLFKMIIVSTVIIPLLSSCSKKDTLPDHTANGATMLPMTLNLTTTHWESKAGNVFVCLFSNVIPSGAAGQSINVYLVSNGQDTLINQGISFMNGQLWATNTQKDLAINYGGALQSAPYLNIKIVIE